MPRANDSNRKRTLTRARLGSAGAKRGWRTAVALLAAAVLAILGSVLPTAHAASSFSGLSAGGPEAANSAALSAAPALNTPTVGAQCSSYTGATVSLSWTDSQSSTTGAAVGSYLVSSYEVLRATASAGPYSVVQTVSGSPPATSTTDCPSAAATSTTYYYEVQAFHANFSSNASSAKSVTVVPYLSASCGYGAGVIGPYHSSCPEWNTSGSWTEMSCSDGTIDYWSITTTGGWTADATWTFTGLTVGHSYTVKVWIPNCGSDDSDTHYYKSGSTTANVYINQQSYTSVYVSLGTMSPNSSGVITLYVYNTDNVSGTYYAGSDRAEVVR